MKSKSLVPAGPAHSGGDGSDTPRPQAPHSGAQRRPRTPQRPSTGFSDLQRPQTSHPSRVGDAGDSPSRLGLCPAGRGADPCGRHQGERARCWGGSGRPGRPEGSAERVWETGETSRDGRGHGPRRCGRGRCNTDTPASGLPQAAATNVPSVSQRRRRAAGDLSLIHL